MPYCDEFRSEVLGALRAAPYSIQAVAAAFSIHSSTVARWAAVAGLELPTPEDRMVYGQVEGARRRWGDYLKRRKRTRKMRAAGKSLEEIAAAVGYRSISGASYGARSEVEA